MPSSSSSLCSTCCGSCNVASISKALFAQDVPLGYSSAPLCKAVRHLRVLATKWLNALQQSQLCLVQAAAAGLCMSAESAGPGSAADRFSCCQKYWTSIIAFVPLPCPRQASAFTISSSRMPSLLLLSESSSSRALMSESLSPSSISPASGMSSSEASSGLAASSGTGNSNLRSWWSTRRGSTAAHVRTMSAAYRVEQLDWTAGEPQCSHPADCCTNTRHHAQQFPPAADCTTQAACHVTLMPSQMLMTT